MTDPRMPDDPGPVAPDVELASAHLDGEVGADERVRAESPTVQAHAAALRSVVDRVRDVPPPPAGLVDDHVAQAMAALDGQGRVVPLARRSATPWWQRIPLGAVAAALVVIALFGAIGFASQGQDDDSATASLDSADDSGDSTAGGEAGSPQDGTDEALEDAQRETATFETDSALGAGGPRPFYETVDDLAGELRAELAGPTASTAAPSDQSTAPTSAGEVAEEEGSDGASVDDPCGAVALLGLDPAAVVLVRSVVVSGDEVTVVVHAADGERRLTVVDDASCSVFVDQAL